MHIALTLSRKIIAGFSLALLVTIAVGIVSYRNAANFIDSSDVVARTHRSIGLLQAVLADIVSAESEARGYVITGKEDFLTLYRKATRDAERNLRELKANVRDPANRQRLRELERLMRERLERLRVTLETRQLEGLEAVPRISGPGKALMDELREVALEIETRQRTLLDERDATARQLARRTIAMVIATGILATLVAAVGVVVLRADVMHRERLEREVLEISEREQRRIGQDLHDGLCQELTGVSLLSRSLQHQLAGAPAADAAKVTQLVNDCIEQTRRVTRGLHPVPDEPMGLQLALAELAASVTATARVPCRLECPHPVPIPAQIAATNLYRIAQEAVQNALRHAGATQIAIGLRLDEQAITLTVADDGCGLPETRTRRGLGLDIMDYRADSMSAHLTLTRAESGGTIVTCVLPRSAID
jgi:signal transduction histidine kinase